MERERQSFKTFKVKEEVPYSEYEKALKARRKAVLERAGWVLKQKSKDTVRARLVATQVSEATWILITAQLRSRCHIDL